MDTNTPHNHSQTSVLPAPLTFSKQARYFGFNAFEGNYRSLFMLRHCMPPSQQQKTDINKTRLMLLVSAYHQYLPLGFIVSELY